jgi:transcriptional regulator with XRE-family HTH domain
MTSSPGDTPATARQRVRRELRRARRATELTQTDVAKSLGWSLSKVQRIEIGEVAVSETDLRALLDLLSVTADDTIATLVEDARLARRERWSTAPEHRKYLTPALRKLLQFEAAAAEIRSYQHFVVPGLLQTPAMAEYILDQARDVISPQERRVRFEVRMLRREQVIERLDGPRYHLLLDESVLLRRLGGALLMAEQLENLAEVAARPNLFVRILPLDVNTISIAGMATTFVLLYLSDDNDDIALYHESLHQDDMVHDAEKIAPFRDGFEKLWEHSLPEDASLRRIKVAAMTLRSQMDLSQAVRETF